MYLVILRPRLSLILLVAGLISLLILKQTKYGYFDVHVRNCRALSVRDYGEAEMKRDTVFVCFIVAPKPF